MKILLVADDSSYNRHTLEALRSNNHEVEFIDSRQDYSLPALLRSSRLWWRVSRRVPLLRRRAKRAFANVLKERAVAFAPAVLLAIKGMELKPEIIVFLQERNIKTVCWFPENAANEPYATWVRTVGPLWDHFLSFDSAIIEQMSTDRHANVGVLPFGSDAEGFASESVTQADRQRYSCDVAFIGAPYPDRVKLLERVANIDLKIWGWSGWKKTPLAKFWRGPLDAKESGKVYRLAKICVNTNVAPLTKGANCRTYEIPAAGGFELSDEPADLSQSFLIGKELDVFHSPQEFEDKVRFWLCHDDERRTVAQAGHKRLKRDHTLQARMKDLVQIISS